MAICITRSALWMHPMQSGLFVWLTQHVKGTNLKSRKTQNIAPSKPSSYARIAVFLRNHTYCLILVLRCYLSRLHIHNSHLNDKTWLNVWPFQVAAGSSILSTSWARCMVFTSDVATVVTVSTSGGVAASSSSSWRLCENIPPLSQEQLQEDELLILLVLQSNWKNCSQVFWVAPVILQSTWNFLEPYKKSDSTFQYHSN